MRGRKPNVPTEQIVRTLFEAGQPLSARELGINATRANVLVNKWGVLVPAKSTAKVTTEDGVPSRGRPRHLFRLSDRERSRARRQAARVSA